jgi:hypothetical protein
LDWAVTETAARTIRAATLAIWDEAITDRIASNSETLKLHTSNFNRDCEFGI